jgi:hypothetical protein
MIQGEIQNALVGKQVPAKTSTNYDVTTQSVYAVYIHRVTQPSHWSTDQLESGSGDTGGAMRSSMYHRYPSESTRAKL